MTQPTQTNFVGDTRMGHAALGARVRVGRREQDQRCEPKVRLNKNGTSIESIHITCACGEEIVVKCQYADVTE